MRITARGLAPAAHEIDSACQDANPVALLAELLRRSEVANARLRELEATTNRLRCEAALESHRLEAIFHELALAAERGGNGFLASFIRLVVDRPSVASSGAVCALDSVRACALHAKLDCARCRALGQVQALSNREREVLRLMSDGSRSPSIAARLDICVATVEVHRRNIMRKLGLHTIAALTKYAVREGLTSL